MPTAADQPFEPFLVSATEEHVRSLAEHRILTANSFDTADGWLKPGFKVAFHAPTFVEPYACFRRPNHFFSLGAFSFSRTPLPARARAGRYCAIADRVEVMDVDHPIDRISISALAYNTRQVPIQAALQDRGVQRHRTPAISRPPAIVTIGNDVWIGSSVLFKRGISIGDGAVVAARAIVTRDVPPYAVVAGSPATVKRYRFPDRLIERLMGSRWWDFHPADLQGLDVMDGDAFLDGLDARREKLATYRPQPIRLDALFAEIALAAGQPLVPIRSGAND